MFLLSYTCCWKQFFQKFTVSLPVTPVRRLHDIGYSHDSRAQHHASNDSRCHNLWCLPNHLSLSKFFQMGSCSESIYCMSMFTAEVRKVMHAYILQHTIMCKLHPSAAVMMQHGACFRVCKPTSYPCKLTACTDQVRSRLTHVFNLLCCWYITIWRRGHVDIEVKESNLLCITYCLVDHCRLWNWALMQSLQYHKCMVCSTVAFVRASGISF